MRNRYPLQTLLNENPKRYKTDKFTTEATIVGISTTLDWFYIACPDCLKKLTHSNGLLKCHNHGPLQKDPKHMFCFKAYIADETTQVAVTFFSPMADALTGLDCNKMVMDLGYTDPRILPDPILMLKGLKKIFQFHFNQKSVVGNVDFVIDKIMEIVNTDCSNPTTPQDETQCMEFHEQAKVSTSKLNKRKVASVDSTTLADTRKHVKRCLFQEQGDNQSLKHDGDGKLANKLEIGKGLETHKNK